MCVDGHLWPPAALTRKCKPDYLPSARGARVREGQKSPLRHPFVTYFRAQRLTRHEAGSVAPKHRKPRIRLAEPGGSCPSVTGPNRMGFRVLPDDRANGPRHGMAPRLNDYIVDLAVGIRQLWRAASCASCTREVRPSLV